ncbi:MAG: orotate phosphoribosyltransferase [Endomicrobium sp.]|nr:orotate phosphoribosyltransferase [Endomicrobium sp.]
MNCEFLNFFINSGAILNGHFELSSGLHSDTYFQLALIFQDHKKTSFLAEKLVEKIMKNITKKIDVIVSPAIGGIIIGYEVGRILNIRSIFTERINNEMILRRGFSIYKNENILFVEDVITTGLSINEVMLSLKTNKTNISLISSLVDRSVNNIDFGIPKISLLNFNVKNYRKEECPMCNSGNIAIKPGSRRYLS